MPASFQKRAETIGVPRSVGDYLAGMTDHFAQHEFQHLFAR
jgi:dGTP triphosphohydrolase